MMFWNEHMPPHSVPSMGKRRFWWTYGMRPIIEGLFPFRQLKLVLAWCEIHREELMRNWESAQRHDELQRINPLTRHSSFGLGRLAKKMIEEAPCVKVVVTGLREKYIEV
ncbi:MAG: DUF4160 domain-containing protein [Bacteroidota bacterium]